MPRKSLRVQFPGGAGFPLGGILDLPVDDAAIEDQTLVASGSFPVAVFSHCFTCNKDLKAIVRISRALAERGIAVLRYDMTGLGSSQGDFSQTHFTSNLADAHAAIQYASEHVGPVTTLIGHSFGGAASLAIAGQASRQDSATFQPRSVITLAAPSDTTHLATLLARMNPKIESEGSGDVSIGGRTWRIRKEMLADFRSHALPDLVAAIACRVLVFHSPSDATVGYDHAIRIQSLIQSGRTESSVSVVAVDGADHLLSENGDD
ncbi:MAG: alpha/beta fold hydrolase, partial [Planctomycetota bacterium]